MAEFVMKDMVEKAGLSHFFEIASAATSTEEIGNPVYPPVRRLLAAHQIDCSGKTARQIRKSDYSAYDLLIGMDDANIRNMQRAFGGDPERKIHLLLAYGRQCRSVADPWYTRDFEATWSDVCEGCHGILEMLKAQGKMS